MTVANGSQVRLADVSEATINTIPTSPVFQVMRYQSADIRLAKQTDIPDEIRGDRNVASIVDVGRMVQGSVNTLLSYGTYDTWFERLMCASWATNVLKNGVVDKTGTLELTFEQGTTDSYIRYTGTRINSLDLQLSTKQGVSANWGMMGITSPTPTTAIVTGATYTAATTSEVFNAGLNLGSLTMTSTTMSSTPKIRSLSLSIRNNISPVDVVGQYAPYAHILGRFEVTGTAEIMFESLAAYNAILGHEDTALSFTLTDSASKAYAFSLPKLKMLDGGPVVGGNGQAVVISVPFQGFYDSSSTATLTITRTP